MVNIFNAGFLYKFDLIVCYILRKNISHAQNRSCQFILFLEVCIIIPWMTKAKKCSDLAVNIWTTDSSHYFKNLSFNKYLYITLFNHYCIKSVFNIKHSWQCSVLNYILAGIPTSSFQSQQFIPVGILKIHFTTSERMTIFLCKKIWILWKCPIRKKFTTQFCNIYRSYSLK
jgi:hypothetical protein